MNVNELKNLVKSTINEMSSLSRLRDHISVHDCAIITSFRNDPTDPSLCKHSVAPATFQDQSQLGMNRERPLEPKLEVNKLNNRDLKAKLLDYGYGVTKVDGSYVEDFGSEIAKEVKEDSLFVVNLKDDPKFVENIKKLGEHFCQDSVLIIPESGQNPYLLGTNGANFPGLGQKIELGKIQYGKEAEFMTKVKNRPITTKVDESLETFEKLPRLQKMAVRAIASKFLK